jgi:hypothetical protein
MPCSWQSALAVTMSWFERRQQAAKLEVEVEPAVVPVLDTAPEQQRRVRKEPRRSCQID